MNDIIEVWFALLTGSWLTMAFALIPVIAALWALAEIVMYAYARFDLATTDDYEYE